MSSKFQSVALGEDGSRPVHPGLAAKAKKDTQAATRKRFEGAFATIRSELLEHFSGHGMPPDAIDWYSRVREFIMACISYRAPDRQISMHALYMTQAS